MISIDNIKQLEDLLEKYNLKSSLSNNYLLASSYEAYINDKTLFVIEEAPNVYILQKKEGYYRIYYYLNDLAQPMKTTLDLPSVLEILYRGEKRKPEDAIGFWKNSGFQQHLTRDNLLGKFSQLSLPDPNEGVDISFAKSEEEILFVQGLLQTALDKYTGDQMSLEELKEFGEEENILIAKIDGQAAGFLRFYIKNTVSWLGHIVVDSEFRGKGIAKELVRQYIIRNKVDENSRFSLWVIQDNLGAVKLYDKFGFQYARKSTTSLLKLN